MRTRSLMGSLARALTGAAILALATLSPALAVEPPDEPGVEPPPLPEGVTADATVTVRFLEPVADGGGPIADAFVILTVTRGGEVIAESWAVSDPDGQAVFEGVARASDGGDPTLATAYAWTEPTPPDEGCAVVSAWKGVTADVPVEPATDIEIVADVSEGEVCVGDGGGTGGELPDGVVADATLVVTVLDDEGQPLPYAEVILMAWTGDESQTFWGVGTTADEFGVATFTELPRSDDGGPAVTWHVEAWASDEADIDGCTFVTYYSGSADLAAASGESSLEVGTAASEGGFGWCDEPGDDAPILGGIVRGPDGEPLAGVEVSIVMVRADGATWSAGTTTAEDGTFGVRVHDWGSDESPALLSIGVRGEVTRTEPTEDETCQTVYGLTASFEASVALSGGASLEAVDLTTAEGELGMVCEEVPGSENDNGAGGPRDDDLPATDTVGSATTGPGLAGTLAILVAAFAALVVVLRRQPAPIREPRAG